MNTLSPSLLRTSAWVRGLAAVSLVAGAWALSTAASQAHARDVYWSVGVNGPGVTIGASNAPVVVHQPPAYYYAPPVVVQPAPFSRGQTAIEPSSEIGVEEEYRPVMMVNPTASLSELVDAINRMGVPPGDLVAILEALSQAGALTAELVII